MKIKRKQMLRLKEMLMQDRNEKGDDFLNLLKKDLTTLLNEYFVINNFVDCFLEKEGEEIKISITAKASRIKSFGTIPN